MTKQDKFEGWMGLDKDSVNGKMVWQTYDPKPFEETDVDIGDSPCPPPSKATTLKIRKPRALSRAETYGPGRMPLQY